jgi:hypothetical protein
MMRSIPLSIYFSVLYVLIPQAHAMEGSTQQKIQTLTPPLLRHMTLLLFVQKAVKYYSKSANPHSHLTNSEEQAKCFSTKCPLKCWTGLDSIIRPPVLFLLQRNNNTHQAYIGALIHENEEFAMLFLPRDTKNIPDLTPLLQAFPRDAGQKISFVDHAKKILDDDIPHISTPLMYQMAHIWDKDPVPCQEKTCIFSESNQLSADSARLRAEMALVYACSKNPDVAFLAASICSYLPTSGFLQEIFMPQNFQDTMTLRLLQKNIQHYQGPDNSVAEGFLGMMQTNFLSYPLFIEKGLWLLGIARYCSWIDDISMQKIYLGWACHCITVKNANKDQIYTAWQYLIGNIQTEPANFFRFREAILNSQNVADVWWRLCLLPSSLLAKQDQQAREWRCAAFINSLVEEVDVHTATLFADFLSADDCIKLLWKSSDPAILKIITGSINRSPKKRICDFAEALLTRLELAPHPRELQQLIAPVSIMADTYFSKREAVPINLRILMLHPLADKQVQSTRNKVNPLTLAHCLRRYFSCPTSFSGRTREQDAAAHEHIKNLVKKLEHKAKKSKCQKKLCKAFLGGAYSCALEPIAWDTDLSYLVRGLAAMHDWEELELLFRPKEVARTESVLKKISKKQLYAIQQSLFTLQLYEATHDYYIPSRTRKMIIDVVADYITQELKSRRKTKKSKPKLYNHL